MTTTTARQAATAVTTPYALRALADHIDNHNLPAPYEIEIGHGITLWLAREGLAGWLAAGIHIANIRHEPLANVPGYVRHVADATLDGSCVRLELKWLTQPTVDHEFCRGDEGDCEVVLCFCEQDQPCHGCQPRGCPHVGEILCDDHRGECVDCRTGSAS